MDRERYVLAGWLAIGSAVLFVPECVLALLSDLRPQLALALLPVYVPVALLGAACSLYALYRLRTWLHEHYQYHAVDLLITLLIVGSIALTTFGVVIRGVAALGMAPKLVLGVVMMSVLAALGIPLAVLGIIFAVRLLRASDRVNNMLKAFAYTNIAACLCFITIILAPFGLLLSAAANVLLGIVFLGGGQEEPETEPEFV
jgi:hypothetical protein